MPRLARMPKKEPEKPKHSSIKTSTLMAMSIALAFASLGLMVTSAAVSVRHTVNSFVETTRGITSTYIYSKNSRTPVANRIVTPNEVVRGTQLSFVASSNSSTIGVDARFAFVPIEFSPLQASPKGPFGSQFNHPSTDSLYRGQISRNTNLWSTNPSFNWTAPLTSGQGKSDYVDVVVYTGSLQRSRGGQPTSVILDDYAIIRFKLMPQPVSSERSLIVSKNSAFVDRSGAFPTGVPGQRNVRLGSFVVSGLTTEPASLTQITLKDPSATQHLGDDFENVYIAEDITGQQFGTTVSSPNTGATQGVYSFSYVPTTASPTYRIVQGGSAVFNVFGTIKQNPQHVEALISPAVLVDGVTGAGVNTSGNASNPADVSLHSAYILRKGNLTVSVDSATPAASQLVMGSTGVPLARFLFTATGEAVTVNKIVLTDVVTAGATGTMKNLKLFYTNLQNNSSGQLGPTVQLRAQNPEMPVAEFSGLNMVVSSGQTVSLTLKGDVDSYDNGAVSGSTHTFKVSAGDYDFVAAGSQSAIGATGGESGATLDGTYLDFGGEVDADQVANTMTVYRSKLTASFSPDTPAGTSVGSPEQTVAKINVSNVANSGAYDAILKVMDLSFAHTGFDASKPRVVRVYKDSLSYSNLLASSSVRLSDGRTNFGTTGTVSSLTLSNGGGKTLLVTMDTSDASSGKVLTVNVPQEFIVWSDGATASIRKVDTLPLTPKALAY